MNYGALKSIIKSKKMKERLSFTRSQSFFASDERPVPFIEPDFEKREFPVERPTILLVSAAGASGKTTTARALSADTGLPILDLALHKPVAGDALTGILTSHYRIDDLARVLGGLGNGEHGLIIDGIDEARSKVNSEEVFEAFLDDIAKCAKGAPATTIVILGRSNVLLNTWCYLSDLDVSVGLVQLKPFDIDQARSYIDAFAGPENPAQITQYEGARDEILDALAATFAAAPGDDHDEFLSFLGYAPVLDAVATLLKEEKNYHRVKSEVASGMGRNVEVRLLVRIGDYLLDRERDEKAMTNFIEPLIRQADHAGQQSMRESLFSREEQCARILALALGRDAEFNLIEDAVLDESYEQGVTEWLPEHPFVKQETSGIRNAVFGAIALARCALSSKPEWRALACDYAAQSRATYHLAYFMESLRDGKNVDLRCFNMILQSCAEFVGPSAHVAMSLDGVSWEEGETSDDRVELEVDVAARHGAKRFSFAGQVDSDEIVVGPLLMNARVNLSCGLVIVGAAGAEFFGDCFLSASRVRFETPGVAIRDSQLAAEDHGSKRSPGELYLNVYSAEGGTQGVSLGGGVLEIQCVEHSLVHPLAQYVRKRAKSSPDAQLDEKYRRLRRILCEFASHSKGGLAKYRQKIEHARVLQNQAGRSVLDALLKHEVLWTDPRFYYVNPTRLHEKLGVTWHQLRRYESSRKLDEFLKSVEV